jgi:hypothetical protein
VYSGGGICSVVVGIGKKGSHVALDLVYTLKAFQFLNANLPQKDTTLKNAWISGGGYVLQKMDFMLPIDRCCL